MSFFDFFKNNYDVYSIYDFTDEVLIAELKAYEKGFNMLKEKYNYVKNYILLNNNESLKNWENIYSITPEDSIFNRKDNIFNLASLNNHSFLKIDIVKMLKAFQIELDMAENEDGEIILSNILKDGEYIKLDKKSDNHDEIYKIFQKIFPINTIIKYDNGIFSFTHLDNLDYKFIDFDNLNKPWIYLIRE